MQGGNLDPNEFGTFIQDPAVEDNLRIEPEVAAERGIFGAPVHVCREQGHSGQDRLDFVRGALP